MKLLNNSGPAIFIYCVITISLITCVTCFSLYYGNVNKTTTIFWVGIVTFTIMYHLWLRLIMGNVCKLFKKHINYNQRWFKPLKFEKRLYKMLQVKKWKGKALTYNPELFSLKDYSLEEIANTMAKVEIDHWINEIISLTTILFSIAWGNLPIFLISALAAMIFDGQFIIIQRYNRPRIVNILQKTKSKKVKDKAKMHL